MSEVEKKSRKRKPKAVKAPHQEVRVIRILNPFDPRDTAIETIQWAAKKTLSDYFPLEAREVVVSVNGKIVVKEHFQQTYLEPTDTVVICPIPTGGGNGKQILSIVAMIALGVVAPYAAAALNGALGFSTVAGSVAMAVTTAGVMMAGSALVHAVFAPSTPTSNNSAGKTSTTYGIDGAKNTSIENVPLPVCYGEFRMGGNIVDLYVENSGDTQVLFMLLAAGEGPVAEIKDIKINGNPITDYKKVEVMVRLGDSVQEPIPWFNNIIKPVSKNLRLSTTHATHTTDIIDCFRADFVAPQGLCTVSTKDGSLSYQSVPIDIQYRKVGTEAWVSMSPVNEVEEWTSEPYSGSGDFTDADFKANGYRRPIFSTATTMGASQRTTVRTSFTSPVLEAGHYEIKIARVGEKSTDLNVLDDVFLSDINEIQNENLSYPNTALIGLRVELSDQINGLPNVTYINGGRLINTYGVKDGVEGWHVQASKNPAWIVWDMFTNTRFGGGLPPSRLDFSAFRRLAEHCETEGIEWNGPIDTEMNVWDAAQLVLRVGHAQIVNVGTRYSLVIDKEDSPTMMFSVANMIEGSYKETWLPTVDRANEINVTFFDKEDEYKQRTIKIVDPASITSGEKVRSAAVTLYGVDNADRALKEGFLLLNMNRFILKTVQFAAPLEAIGCTVGSVILIQTDMTDWATSGRFGRGSSNSLMRLDRPVRMIPGRSYKLLVHRDFALRYSGTVTSIIGDTLYLSGFDGALPIKRIKIKGKDIAVFGTFSASGAFGVSVDSSAGIVAGDSYELFDTDVIEEHAVVNSEEDTQELLLQSPALLPPEEFTTWMFGETNKIKAPFRVKTITGSHEYRREITAVQYNPVVYENSRFAGITPGNTGSTNDIIDVVADLQAVEDIVPNGASFESRIVLGWKAPTVGHYIGADIYVARGDAPLVKVATVERDCKYEMSGVSIGEKFKFKVVAFEVFGLRASFEESPTVSIEVLGKKMPPPNVQSLSVFVTSDGTRKFEFGTANMPSDVTNGGGYRIKYAMTGAVANWQTALPLHDGLIKASPYETKNPKSGVYDLFICAVDSLGNESVTPFQLPAIVIGDADFIDAKHATGVAAGNMDYWLARINASVAANKAETAQSAADLAIAGITSIANDNILSRGEKPAVIINYTTILSEKAGILAVATSYSVSTTAYVNAITALTAYLTGLAPAYDDATKDTPIDGATFRQKFIDVYVAKQNVLNAISSTAKIYIATAQTAAESAQSTANAASLDALSALADLSKIASDSVLSRGEKPTIVRDYNDILAEKDGLVASANLYLVSTAAYTGSITALTTYLTGLSPSYSDVTQNTDIVAANFRKAFSDVYLARQNLVNAIAAAALDKTAAAQNAANLAATNASAAVSELSNIANDNILSKGEKSAVVLDFNYLNGEKASIDAQAVSFGLSSATYDTAISALATYLGELTPAYNLMTADTPINGAIFRQKFIDVYTTRQALLNAIDTKSKTLATNAQNAANDASAAAIAAMNEISDIVDDNILSKGEKATVVADYGRITSERPGIVSTANEYGVSSTAYTTAISSLTNYLTNLSPAYNDTSINTTIVGTTFRQKFSDVYSARQALQNTIALRALSYINTAQSTADSAATTANTASINAGAAITELGNIANDNILSKGEKGSVVRDYNEIIAEKLGIDNQADLFSQSRSDYNAAVSALTNYLTGLSPSYSLMTADTPITGATFRQKFLDVYTSRQALLNAIAAKAKSIADDAKTAANNALNAANNANTAASTAQTAANTANAEIAKIADDNILSKGEKGALLRDYNEIINQRDGIVTQATALGVTSTAYVAAITTLTNYLTGLSPAYNLMTADTPINGVTLRTNFINVYGERQTVLNAIAAKASSGEYLTPGIISTAKIGQNQISKQGSVYVKTQAEVPNTNSWQLVANFAHTAENTQQFLLWASAVLAGAHIGTSTNYDNQYDGNYWKFNTAPVSVDFQFMLFGAASGIYVYETTSSVNVPPGNSVVATVQGVFPSLPAQLYNVMLSARLSSTGERIGIRQISLVGLELKK